MTTEDSVEQPKPKNRSAPLLKRTGEILSQTAKRAVYFSIAIGVIGAIGLAAYFGAYGDTECRTLPDNYKYCLGNTAANSPFPQDEAMLIIGDAVEDTGSIPALNAFQAGVTGDLNGLRSELVQMYQVPQILDIQEARERIKSDQSGLFKSLENFPAPSLKSLQLREYVDLAFFNSNSEDAESMYKGDYTNFINMIFLENHINLLPYNDLNPFFEYVITNQQELLTNESLSEDLERLKNTTGSSSDISSAIFKLYTIYTKDTKSIELSNLDIYQLLQELDNSSRPSEIVKNNIVYDLILSIHNSPQLYDGINNEGLFDMYGCIENKATCLAWGAANSTSGEVSISKELIELSVFYYNFYDSFEIAETNPVLYSEMKDYLLIHPDLQKLSHKEILTFLYYYLALSDKSRVFTDIDSFVEQIAETSIIIKDASENPIAALQEFDTTEISIVSTEEQDCDGTISANPFFTYRDWKNRISTIPRIAYFNNNGEITPYHNAELTIPFEWSINSTSPIITISTDGVLNISNFDRFDISNEDRFIKDLHTQNPNLNIAFTPNFTIFQNGKFQEVDDHHNGESNNSIVIIKDNQTRKSRIFLMASNVTNGIIYSEEGIQTNFINYIEQTLDGQLELIFISDPMEGSNFLSTNNDPTTFSDRFRCNAPNESKEEFDTPFSTLRLKAPPIQP